MNNGTVSLVRLWDVVLLPLQGEISDAQGDLLCEQVLRHIEMTGPRGLVVDLSGVAFLDSHLCSTIAHLAAAAMLMGTPAFIAGISPQIAMTLETMGVSFRHLTPVSSVEKAFERLGIVRHVVAKGAGALTDAELLEAITTSETETKHE